MAVYHARSNSLPSKQHPIIIEFDEQLSRLRSSQEVSSSSSTSVTSKLTGLQDLFDSVDQLISLPRNQQALSQDKALDGSLRLLDLCNAAKDALSQAKESVQEIQSIFRRRRVGDVALTSEVKNFLVCKKLAKKALHKVMENKGSFKNQENVSVLREVESITLEVFETLFSFISGSKKSRKSSGWSIVSQLVTNSKRVVCEEVNEFQSVEAELSLLLSQKAKKSDNKVEERAQNELQRLEICVRDLEERVESIYRRLIKTRVSLLNILNH